mmetsp:Transcript_21692/g.60329  ORF Transcript_21692/g.60329 Transcript_21692/m.60329 type:complete len:456 (+) Transcript_21692:105-1472(+)
MERLVRTFSRPFIPETAESDPEGEEVECLAGHLQDLDLSDSYSFSGQLVEVDLQGDWEPMSVGPGFASNQPVIWPSRHPHHASPAVHRTSPPGLATPASCGMAVSSFAGQAMAVLLMATGLANQLLSDSGFQAPKLQSCLCFAAVFAVWLPVVAIRGELSPIGHGWLWAKLAGLGVVEAQANSLAVSAYQYTSLVSVQLLDNLTIPLVMVLSFLVLKVRYQWGHYAGAVVCFSGVVTLIIYDSNTGIPGVVTDHTIIGDLCMVGATGLYAVSNLAQEYLLKDSGTTPGQWLLGVGLSASLTSGLQCLVVESDTLQALPWDGKAPMYLTTVVVVQLAFYSLTPYFLLRTSASFFNLSLLASDCYAAIAGSVFFSLHFSPLYLVSLVLVAGGAGIYSLIPEVKGHQEPRAAGKPPMEPTGGQLLEGIELCRVAEEAGATRASPSEGQTSETASPPIP